MEVEDDGLGGQNLIVKFIGENDVIDDYFTINKTGITLKADANKPTQKSIEIYYISDHNMVNIKVNPNERLKKVKFYNSIGKLVKKSRKEAINVCQMPKGMYVVEIITNKKTYNESVMLE